MPRLGLPFGYAIIPAFLFRSPESPIVNCVLPHTIWFQPCRMTSKRAPQSVGLYSKKGSENSTMAPDSKSNAMPRLYSALLIGASIVISAILLARVVLNFRNQYFLTHVEGVWLTCAYDFLHGVFYRPLFSSLGYGGTRYFPLYFVLVAALSKIFGSLETSALAVSLASVILICYAVYRFLQRSGVGPVLSWAGVTSILAVTTTQQALLGAKGDTLAALLNLLGLVLCLRPEISRAALYLAAFFFTLAFATKLTSVFGVAAVVLGWWFAKRHRDALQLAAATACGCLVVLGTMYFASHGRVFAIFRACASGGGSLSYKLQAPVHFLSKAFDVDPVFVLFLVPAAALGWTAFKNSKTEILPLYFALALLVTVVIFSSPGIGVNHLLDLDVAAVLLLIISISRLPAAAEVGAGILAFTLLVAIAPTATGLHGDLGRRSFPRDVREVLDRIPGPASANDKPILAENPMVVLKSGKSPYVLDPFMFRILAATHPELTSPFWEKMKHRGFSAVVLQYDPRSAEGQAWYTRTHFGGEFLDDLDANYAFGYSVGQMLVYLPK